MWYNKIKKELDPMDRPIMLTPQDIINIVLAVAAAIITLSGAITVIVAWIKKAQEPEINQNKRIQTIESHLNEIDKKLAMDKKRLDNIEYGHEVTQEALLALLNYQLNPENKDVLKDAKRHLETYLVRRGNAAYSEKGSYESNV